MDPKDISPPPITPLPPEDENITKNENGIIFIKVWYFSVFSTTISIDENATVGDVVSLVCSKKNLDRDAYALALISGAFAGVPVHVDCKIFPIHRLEISIIPIPPDKEPIKVEDILFSRKSLNRRSNIYRKTLIKKLKNTGKSHLISNLSNLHITPPSTRTQCHAIPPHYAERYSLSSSDSPPFSLKYNGSKFIPLTASSSHDHIPLSKSSLLNIPVSALSRRNNTISGDFRRTEPSVGHHSSYEKGIPIRIPSVSILPDEHKSQTFRLTRPVVRSIFRSAPPPVPCDINSLKNSPFDSTSSLNWDGYSPFNLPSYSACTIYITISIIKYVPILNHPTNSDHFRSNSHSFPRASPESNKFFPSYSKSKSEHSPSIDHSGDYLIHDESRQDLSYSGFDCNISSSCCSPSHVNISPESNLTIRNPSLSGVGPSNDLLSVNSSFVSSNTYNSIPDILRKSRSTNYSPGVTRVATAINEEISVTIYIPHLNEIVSMYADRSFTVERLLRMACAEFKLNFDIFTLEHNNGVYIELDSVLDKHYDLHNGKSLKLNMVQKGKIYKLMCFFKNGSKILTTFSSNGIIKIRNATPKQLVNVFVNSPNSSKFTDLNYLGTLILTCRCYTTPLDFFDLVMSCIPEFVKPDLESTSDLQRPLEYPNVGNDPNVGTPSDSEKVLDVEEDKISSTDVDIDEEPVTPPVTETFTVARSKARALLERKFPFTIQNDQNNVKKRTDDMLVKIQEKFIVSNGILKFEDLKSAGKKRQNMHISPQKPPPESYAKTKMLYPVISDHQIDSPPNGPALSVDVNPKKDILPSKVVTATPPECVSSSSSLSSFIPESSPKNTSTPELITPPITGAHSSIYNKVPQDKSCFPVRTVYRKDSHINENGGICGSDINVSNYTGISYTSKGSGINTENSSYDLNGASCSSISHKHCSILGGTLNRNCKDDISCYSPYSLSNTPHIERYFDIIDEVIPEQEIIVKNVLTLIWIWLDLYYFDFCRCPKLQEKLTNELRTLDNRMNGLFKTEIEDILVLLDDRTNFYNNLIQCYKLVTGKGKSMFGMIKTIDAGDIASQLCLYDLQIVRSIHPIEYLNSLWKKSEDGLSPLMNYFIHRFDVESLWTATEILCMPTVKGRASIIKKFIIVAAKCLEYNNFFSTFAILAGLGSIPIARLKKSWNLLSEKTRAIWDKLQPVTDPSKNMKNYRDAISKVSPPIIPFLPIFLKDLLFADDGNPTYIEDKLINFDKFTLISNLVNKLCSSTSVEYDIEPIIHVQNYVKNPPIFKDSRDLMCMSLKCEPKTNSP